MPTTEAPAVSHPALGLRGERGRVLLAVMLSTGLVAIDSTILATAVPNIVSDLGGFTQFPWLFSVYLLTQAVSVPIYGKVADLIGRKPVILLGVALFVTGSVLCGFAWSMTGLILFRALQGLGAGAVQPMGVTIVGDLYSMAERAKIQGYIAAVWAAAAVIGPTLGGVFADFLSWRWIFFVNLPLGLVAFLMLQRRFQETVVRRRTSVDAAGALLLSAGGVLLLLGLLEGGQRWAWDSGTSILLFVAAAVCLALFGFVETRASDPVLPLWIFRRRVLNASNLGSLAVGCVMFGLSSYVPLFGQQVLHRGAVVSGLALAAMSFGWPVAASQAGRIYLTLGFRAAALIGSVLAVAGGLLLLTVDGHSSIYHLALPGLVLGLGFGLVVSPGVVASQSSVAWSSRGVATGANLFARSVGSAVGVAVFGAVVNGVVASRLHGRAPRLDRLAPAILEPALHTAFVVAAAVTVILLVVAVAMPKRVTSPAPETVTHQ